MLRLPVTFFEQRFSGDIAARVELNALVARLLSGDLALAVINVLLMIFFVLLMLQYSVLLTVIGVSVSVLNLAVLRYVSRRRADANRTMLQERGKLIGSLMGGLRVIETFKAIGAENDLFARWTGLQTRMVNFEQQLGYSTQTLTAISIFLFALNAAVILVLGGELVLENRLTVGMLVAFQSLMFSFSQPVGQLISLGSRLQEVDGDLNRLEDVLNYPTDTALDDPVEDQPGVLSGQLELRNVSFGYDPLKPPFIVDFSLAIKPHERIALVGASGSGKSTITKLIAGLYTPWSGAILFDGQDRENITHSVMKRSLALVDQQIALFSGTVQENLTLWNEDTLMTDVLRAAKDASIHEVILQRPDGYKHAIEEGGHNFSGGERQRLEIARALVGNPTLLILDEASSALDPATEAKVDNNIRWRGCTCLIIAHRLSTIRDCDEIIVMDQGQIVERGTHAELMARNGQYVQLINAEANASDSSAAAPVEDFDTEFTSPVSDQTIPAIINREDRLLAVSRVLAQSLGSSAPLDARALLAYRTPAVGLRARPVTLKGTWWRADQGALLAYTKTGHQPVALLRDGKRYLLHDSISGRPAVVTDESAAEIDSSAYLFYRPLPQRRINAVTLLKLGLQTTQHDFLILLGVGLIGGILGIVLPLLTAVVIDDALPSGDHELLRLIGLILAFSAFALALFQIMRGVAAQRIQGKLDSIIQPAVWDRLLNLPASFFRAFTAGDLAERALGISNIKWVLSDAVALSLLSGIFSVTNFLLLFYFDGVMALAGALIVLFSLLVTLFFGGFQLHFQRTRLELEGETSGLVLQLLNGLAKLRVAGAETRAFAVWAEVFNRRQRLIFDGRRIQSYLNVFIAVYPVIASMILFALVYSRATLSTGEFLAFNLAFSQLNVATAQLSGAFITLISAAPYYARLQPILQTAPEVEPTKQPPGKLVGAIAVQNLSFRYADDSPDALRELSFSVDPGEFVAIVGASGSGKSTLVRLLLGFEQPSAGEIYFDGKPLSTLDIQAVRRQIGAVLQNSQVMAGDIYSNIVGTLNLTLDDAWHAARLTGIDEDIRQMPMGMNTHVGEEGSTFSGGQRQRLLIARALAARPRIVIFDEATSAVDDKAQAFVMNSIRQIGITRIVVAHRLSTIAAADRILVFHEGRIVESGSYQNLLAAGGWFSALAQRQFHS